MRSEHDSQLAENLRRWQQSGQPRHWVQCRQGRWDHHDWVALLESLRHSPFWPLDPEAVGGVLEESRRRWRNLRRWEQSGQAHQWVQARQGQWGHADWLELLEALRQSQFWPLDPDGVGEVLEGLQEEWRNLRNWEQSRQAREWVEAHRGQWSHQDWLALWERLQQSEFWPLDREAAEAALEHLTAEWWNLRRWQESGQPRLWVQARQGQWGHADWLELLETLRRSQFWPLDPRAIGALLEQARQRYWNLRHWESSGHAREWVQARQGRWGREDWLALVEDLQRSPFWPIDPCELEGVLEGLRAGDWNLHRWQETGAARAWVRARQGRWSHEEWLALLASLRQSEFWPMRPEAIAGVLQRLNREWWNLHRWRASGLARRWVQAHQGQWGDRDWQDLLRDLQGSEFWPMDPAALGEALEEVKLEERNLRRWQQSGQPRRWLEANGGHWSHRDWLALLDSLRQSEFWPLDSDSVRGLLAHPGPPARQAA